MKAMIIGITLGGITLFAGGHGYCQAILEPINLSRSDAVRMAVRKNIDLRTEAFTTAMAEKDVARNRGIYNPILSASGSGGKVSVPGDPFFDTKSMLANVGLTQFLPTGGSVALATQSGYTSIGSDIPGTVANDWQSTVGITVTQPLLKNAGKETTELNITLAATTLLEFREQFRAATTATVSAVIFSYNRLYTQRQILESRMAALNSAQALLDEIQKRKPGPLQRLESVNAEYAIAQRRKELVDAERNVRDQEATFRYLIGMEEKNQIIPVDPPTKDEPPETEEEAVKAALAFRPELKQLRLAVQESQLQERVARHQTLPELSVSGGGGLNGSGEDFGESYSQIGDNPGSWWSAGMEFSVPLGNAVARNDYHKSKMRTEQAQNQLAAQEWRVRNDVEADLRALISARLQMQTADQALEFAEQRSEEYRKHGLAGATTVQDIINAENDLATARNTQLEAIETFANGVTELWRDIGVLLDRQGVHIDTAQPDNLVGAGR